MMKTEGAHLASIETKDREGAWNPVRSILSTPLFLFLADLCVGLLAYAAAWMVRIYLRLPMTQDLLPQERWDAVDHFWLVLLLSQAFFLYILGMYDDLRVLRFRELVAQLFLACVFQVLSLTSIFYLTNGIFPRSVILVFGFFNFVLLLTWRAYARAQVQGGVRRLLIVGEELASAAEIIEEIDRNPWMGLQIVGMALDEEAAAEKVSELPYPLLGTLEDTQEIVNNYSVDEIIFASKQSWKDQVLHSLSQMQVRRSVRVAILPSVYEIAIGRLRHINIHDTPLIEVRRNPSEPFARMVKRTFDVCFSLTCLTLLSPLLLLISLAILVFSPGPIFYRQERVGFAGEVFSLIKFRTMIPDAEKHSGEIYAEENDPRVTRIGAVLRRFRLDEVPQFLNVLKGDMSFVGPRPERPKFVDVFAKTLPGYNERHKVKPGMTGLAQVRGYYHTAAENKLKYDLAYIYNYSFSLDLLILLETIKVVLVRRGS